MGFVQEWGVLWQEVEVTRLAVVGGRVGSVLVIAGLKAAGSPVLVWEFGRGEFESLARLVLVLSVVLLLLH